MSEEPTLAQAVARYESAEDATDLDIAQRLVTALREKLRRIAEEEEENQPGPGEYMIALDEKHDRMLQVLYDKGRLSLWHVGDTFDQDYWADPPDLEPEALTDFVQGCLDIAWDMAHDATDDTAFPRYRRPPTA